MRPLPVMAFVAALLGPTFTANAQVPDSTPRFRTAAGLAVTRVYEGDATVGAITSTVLSGAASIRVRDRLGVEAHYSRAPGSEGQADLSYYGLLLDALGPAIHDSAAALYLQGGAGWFRADGVLDLDACRPPECFAEGGPNLEPGAKFGAIVGLGTEVSLSRTAFLRLGGRWYTHRAPLKAGLLVGLDAGISW